MSPKEFAKYVMYRLPGFRRLMSPKYPYKISPGQLSKLIQFVDGSRQANGAVVEIGVAQGDTSVYLLEHLKTSADPRTVLLFDTFSGFTSDSIEVEVSQRGKPRSQFEKFRYGDQAIFESGLRRAGYDNFKTFKGDASQFDWASIAPIGAVLLDIDLYTPTKAILEGIYPHLCNGGGIVVDDCLENSRWDGSLQAYQEFIAAHNIPFELVGRKGGVVHANRD